MFNDILRGCDSEQHVGGFGYVSMSVRNEEVGQTLVVHQNICAADNNIRSLAELGNQFIRYRRLEVVSMLFKLRNIEENKENFITLAKAMHAIDDGYCKVVLQSSYFSVIVLLFHRELRLHR